MKFFTFALAVFSCSAAHSQGLILGDLNFFQDEYTFLLNTSLNYSGGSFEESANGNKEEYRRTSSIFRNILTYGFNKKLNAGIELDYALRNRTYFEEGMNGTEGVRTQQEGLSDLRLIANHRVWGEELYLDVVGGLTLGIGNAETARGTEEDVTEGNNQQGHHSLDAAVAVGDKYEKWEWRGLAGFDYHFAGNGEMMQESVSAVEYESEGYMNWIVRASGQYRPSNLWAFAAGLDYHVVGDQSLNLSDSRANYETKTDNYYSLDLAMKHTWNPHTVLTIGYELTSKHDVKTEFGNVPDIETNNGYAHSFSFGAQVLF